MKQICHRDLKLENTLLDGSPAPRLKICDFGYSKVLTVFIFLLQLVSFLCLSPGTGHSKDEMKIFLYPSLGHRCSF